MEVIGAPEHNPRQRAYEQWQARRNDAALFLTHSCRSDLELVQPMVKVNPDDPHALWTQTQKLFNDTSVENSMNNEKALFN